MQPTDESVQEYLDGIAHPVRQRDARTLVEMFARVTGMEPRMWGNIVGFGAYHYAYASGREGDAPAAGFAARKASTTIYAADGADGRPDLLDKLGPHTTSVSCIYIKDLSKVDLGVLEEIIRRSFEKVRAEWGVT